jgi:nucleoside-diphosphate-sugar epimerase
MSDGPKRIVFTGGSGKAGRHVIPELLKKGHQVSHIELFANDSWLTMHF